MTTAATTNPNPLPEPDWEEHRACIFATVLGVINHRATAEDVTQEVIIAAHRFWPLYTGHGTVRAWLWRIARNRALNQRKREQRRLQTIMPLTFDADFGESFCVDVVDPTPDLLQHTIQRCNLDQAFTAIDQLAPEHRQALLLDLGCPNYATAASLAGIPLGTYKARLHFARRAAQTAYLALEPSS
jgi:RNA polymerase sigma-70 factor (ECF subfamily)